MVRFLCYRHPGDRYELKEGGRYAGSRERDRDFDKDRDRDRDRVGYKRERTLPSLMEIPSVPGARYDPNYETRERIARDWEKTRDRELELQERERERQTALAPPGEYVEKPPSKKREPSRGRPVESISGLPRQAAPPAEPVERGPNVNALTYVTPKESPLKEVPANNAKSPEKEKKEKDRIKEKRKKKKDESEKKEKKKKKKVKEKSDKKEGSEPGDVTSNTVEDPEEETKLSEDVPPVREDPLYGDLAVGSDIVDSTVVENYSKPPEVKEEVKDKDVVLAPLPEISKWEKDDEPLSQTEERIQENGSENKQVTSEVLKRAENAIFKKSIIPIHEKKSERKPDVKKSSKEKEKPDVKEVDKVKEEKVEVVEKPKEKENVRVPEKDASPRRERAERTEKREDRERKDDRERRDDRDRERYRDRERREQEREREHKARVLEREKERQVAISKDIERERYLSSKELDRSRSSDRKMETIPLRISAKERLGAKVEDKSDVKKRLEKREVKAEKPRRKEEVKEVEKKKGDERLPGDVIVVNQAATGEQPVVKKRSVSLDTERLVKKIKLAHGVNESTADSSPSSDESVSVKKHKKKKKKKHKKKKKKKKHSSSDSDSSSSSSDSEHEKKRKHKKSKKSKKRKKSKK